MSPHSQQKFYIKDANKFYDYLNSDIFQNSILKLINDFDSNEKIKQETINILKNINLNKIIKLLISNTLMFKNNMSQNYGGVDDITKKATPAFININNLHAEFNKSTIRRFFEFFDIFGFFK